MTVSPNEQDLRNCYYQSAAIVCRRCEEAVDLIIPVLLSQDQMSHVSVQVKNYSRQNKSVELVMLNNERAGLLDICGNDAPYLGLFMQVGCDIKPSLRVLSDPRTPRQSARIKEKKETKSGEKREAKRRKLGKDEEGIILLLFHYGFLTISVTEPTEDHGNGIVVALVGLSKETYPNIQDDVIKLLRSISECWSDPIRYAKHNEEYDSKPAIKSWFLYNDPSLLKN